MIPTRKLIFGLLYGVTGGLIFAITAWGVNSLLLYQAKFGDAWLVFLIGILPVLITSGLAGYLTIVLDNTILGAICWLTAGIIIALISVWLPLWVVPELIPRLHPVLINWVEFSWQDGYTFLVYSAAIVTCIAFVIAGLLEAVLVD